jgi:hypothetical protein
VAGVLALSVLASILFPEKDDASSAAPPA